MRDALLSVLSEPSQPSGVMRICSSNENLNGMVAFYKGRSIIAAQIAGTLESGYDALRKLLSVGEGNYAFLETDDAQSLSFGKPMHISLKAVADLMPGLPESSADLFDEQSLLDEVFAPGGTQPDGSHEKSAVLPEEPMDSTKNDMKAQPDAAWLNSFLDAEEAPSRTDAPILSGAIAPSPGFSLATKFASSFHRIKASRLQPSTSAVPAIVIAVLLAVGIVIWMSLASSPPKPQPAPSIKPHKLHHRMKGTPTSNPKAARTQT